jgi:hypothetical protein
MADAYNMVNVTQGKLEKLVGQDTSSIRKSVQRMVSEDGPQTHASSMNDGFVTQTTQTSMAMDNLDLFPYDDISEDRKE